MSSLYHAGKHTVVNFLIYLAVFFASESAHPGRFLLLVSV